MHKHTDNHTQQVCVTNQSAQLETIPGRAGSQAGPLQSPYVPEPTYLSFLKQPGTAAPRQWLYGSLRRRSAIAPLR